MRLTCFSYHKYFLLGDQSAYTFEGDLLSSPVPLSNALLQDHPLQFNYLLPFTG